MKQSFTVRDLPQADRPRERLQKMGPEALSAQELLAVVLGRGVNGESVAATAQKLLSRFGSLRGVMEASLEDLQSIKGIGLAKAGQLKACMEIGRRQEQTADSCAGSGSKKSVISPDAVCGLVRAKISNYTKEHFLVLSFDVRNKLLGIDTVSVGTLTASLVHPRETFDAAIRRHADHIIVAHNHPSNNAEPSAEDIEITRRIAQAGNILGIELLDHIIVSKGGCISFKEKQLL
jgi:DNA repair protein RadC